MRLAATVSLFTGVAVAHSGVWNVVIDGNKYPARDTRLDGKLGAKRVEWTFRDSGVPWAPIPSVTNPGMACGEGPAPPALKAISRAGASVTVQWSGIVRTHFGPTMTYLAPYQPGVPIQNHNFFKIFELGWDAKSGKWANEIMQKNNRKITLQLPSDIKPGMYVLRTELLALHYANRAQPQFYPHCFNVYINGTGTATPPGVRFPGAYKISDPSLSTSLFQANGSPKGNWDKWVIPGPPVYKGKYDAPVGPKPVVSDKDRGQFPPAFQKKYDAFKLEEDQEALAFNDKLNAAQASLGHNAVKSEANLGPAFSEHFRKAKQMDRELSSLKREAVSLGIAQ